MPVVKRSFTPYKVWGILMALTLVYGVILTIVHNGTIGGGFTDLFEGLWGMVTNPTILTNDYIALFGVGPALVNSALSGLLVLCVFLLVKLPGSGLQMGAFGLTMGFALLGKNPVNMLPILLGSLIYSAVNKGEETLRDSYKKHVTLAVFATCLVPIVVQPAFIPQITDIIGIGGGITLGILFGLFIGFIINLVATTFAKQTNEGLNLYVVGWLAGLVAIAFTVIYQTVGITPFGPVNNNMWNVGPGSGAYNFELYGYLFGVAIYFLIIGVLSGGFAALKFKNLKQSFYLKAADSRYRNNFYDKYGQPPVYIAMGLLALLAFSITLPLGIVHLNGPILGAILSMIGWGGFGKAVFNSIIIIVGVFLGGVVRYFAHPDFFQYGMTFLEYVGTGASGTAIWTAAFWGTCLSPMARFFGWRWGIVVGMLHFTFASVIASFHWGQCLYNNGLAAGFVCMIMIPIIRSFDKKGRYRPENVFPDLKNDMASAVGVEEKV